MSNAYNAKCDHDAAIKTLEAAVDKFPTESELWNGLSDVYKEKSYYDTAIKTLEAAVDKFPRRNGLSDAYKAKGDHDTAIKTLEALIAVGRRRQVSDGMAVMDSAIETLDVAIDKFPRVLRFWTHLSDAYKAKGDHDAVIKTLEVAVDKFPMESKLRDGLNNAYKVKGDLIDDDD